METYRLENLTFTYPTRTIPALCDVSLAIEPGQFVVLCGMSGCGKTTLLRHLKPSATPHGVTSGRIFFAGAPLEELSLREAAAKIGWVMQNPDNQIVTDKVWHELAFGLESLGQNQSEMRLRVAEMASFFGIQEWFHRDVAELSGGQKQLLNLAAVMALQPSVLILDEPTSQLDPIAASEFLAAVGKINRELAVTVILSEQRLEEVFPLCDQAVVMEAGRIIAAGAPAEVGGLLRERGDGLFYALPTPMRIWSGVSNTLPCPVTVRDGRNWLTQLAEKGHTFTLAPDSSASGETPAISPALEIKDVWFQYAQNLPAVIRGLSFQAYPGEISAILGGNGAGKTTMLALLAGIRQAQRGQIKINSGATLGLLPQNPQALFVKKTVREDLLEMLSASQFSPPERQEKLSAVAALCRLEAVLAAHPYDLAGGEQQRVALAKVLLLQPQILLLDEPTKGLDAEFKLILAGILKKLTAAGTAVVLVSHDIEFCAEHATRCALFFDGSIMAAGTPRAFFSGNSFYTTAANRLARHLLPEAITAGDVIRALGGVEPKIPEISGEKRAQYPLPAGSASVITVKPKNKLSVPRRITAGAAALALLATIIGAALNFAGLAPFLAGGELAVNAAANAADSGKYVSIMLALLLESILLTGALTWKRELAPPIGPTGAGKSPLSPRTLTAAVIILLAIPLTIYCGIHFFGDRKYYFISILIILETLLPFALVFERRKPQARELVLIAALCALGVAGRTAFFMLPQFKPVLALVIIAGIALGGETGFLVGAMTGFVSNMFLGQGPWTPWQMFAFGLIGFLAGVLFKPELLRRSPLALSVFGAVAALLIYGGIMDTSQVLMYQSHPRPAMFLAAYLQGVPFNLVHAAGTVVFLLLIAKVMLEKLDRIKVKYGLYKNIKP